jgi:hypothetical protein
MSNDTNAAAERPSAEMIHKATEFANAMAWKRPNLDVLKLELAGQYPPVARALQEHIKLSEWRKRLVLPDLRAFGNETVAVFTDYGGESNDAKFLTYAALVCGWNLTADFHRLMQAVRQQHVLGSKEIEFKDFRMGQLQRSLPGYLNALNLVPGLLFTLAVDKRLASIFGSPGEETHKLIAEALSEAGAGERKPEINEKLLRVVHIAAFLTGLLAHDGQKIFWMTDHDAIVPTPDLHQKTLVLFQRVLGIYARKGFTFPAIQGGVPFQQRNLATLDLLSAADIVAGSLDQYLTQRESVSAEEIKVKQGCERVLQWLAHDGIGLKKMNVRMTPGEGGIIHAAALEFALESPPENPTIIPVKV